MGRPRKAQTRLAFTPLPSSSPASKGYNRQIRDRAAAVSIEGSPRHNQQNSAGNMNGSSDEEDAIQIVQVEDRSLSRDKRKSRRKPRQAQIDFSHSRDPSSFDTPVTLHSSLSHAPSSSRTGIFTRSGARRRRSARDESTDDESDHSLSSDPISSARVTRSSQKAVQVDSDSENDDIVLRQHAPQLIDNDGNNNDDDDDDDDDDDMPTTLGTQRKKRKRRRESSLEGFIDLSPLPESEDDLQIVERPSRRDQEEEKEVEEEEEQPITPRRRLKRRRQLDQQEEEDLAEDLEFLEPSSDVESARKPRIQSAKKTAQQQALEKLKQKRSGQPSETNVVEENLDHQERDGESEEEADGSENDEPPVSSRQMFREDDEDQNFIAEDDIEDDTLGIPDGMPIEFTNFASRKGKDLFKFAVEWMVQKKINPAFSMTDDLYDLTFKKLNDEVNGLAGSKFTSSAWTPDFTLALKSRPEMAHEPIDRSEPEHFMRDHCDACNRSGHPATFQIQFQGAPYYPNTLEEVGGEDEDDENDDDASSDDTPRPANRQAYNHEGREVPPASRLFYVGKFCMANAETAHTLHHWRLHLYQHVEAYLISRGYNTTARIVQRDGWNTRKRRKYANKVVDRMEREGEVRDLWRQFREKIDDARNAKQAGRFDRWR